MACLISCCAALFFFFSALLMELGQESQVSIQLGCLLNVVSGCVVCLAAWHTFRGDNYNGKPFPILGYKGVQLAME